MHRDITERAKSGRLQLTVDADPGAVIDGRRLSGDKLIYGSFDKTHGRAKRA